MACDGGAAASSHVHGSFVAASGLVYERCVHSSGRLQVHVRSVLTNLALLAQAEEQAPAPFLQAPGVGTKGGACTDPAAGSGCPSLLCCIANMGRGCGAGGGAGARALVAVGRVRHPRPYTLESKRQGLRRR